MSNIYVYDANCEDFTNFGLVGALTPASCVFEEEANGLSEITMQHPIDALGKYTQLACNNILMVEVPVRTTPGIIGNSIVTSVEQWVVRTHSTTTKAQRTLYKRKTGSSRIKVLPEGTIATVVEKSDEGRYKVKCQYGTGWMESSGLSYSTSATIADNSQSIESVQPAWTVKPQFFRIYSVEKNISGVTVMARHISYDLLYNLTTYKNTGSVPCATALAAIMAGCVADNDFTAYTNLITERTGVNWTRTNPIDALLNPETGLTALYGASLVRDNWELYVLHDPGLNRGVTVEYGKNMTGITYTESFDEVVTRIIPVGETKDGDDLLLEGDTPWVDSNRINSYPVVYAQELKCENCKVGTDGVTDEIARARMVEQAQAVFDNGGDMPTVEMSVDFINLGDTAEYAQFKNLERLFLWDYVLIRHKLHDIDVTSRIVKIQWDCLLDRMQGMEIGSIGKTLANSGITTWQIPTGFSGSKIAGGTVGGGALQSDIISARHIQSESINTEALQAEAVTTDKLAAGSVTADKLQADIIDAVSIEAISAHIEKIVSENITTDELYVALADLNRTIIGTADIGWAQIKDLVTGKAIITEGVGGQLYISRLAVTEANMVSLTVGELVVKGKDGSFYSVSVDADGNVITTLKQIENDDIGDLTIDAGEKLIEGSVTAACLNAQDIFADNAIIRQLMAANLDVDTLFARDAFIASLNTTDISGNGTIKIMSKRLDDVEGKNTEVYEAYLSGELRGEQGIQGPAGVGIAGIIEYYARHTNGTTAPSSWQSTPPTLTSVYRYLWNYETITYTDSSTFDTKKRVIGVYGNTGAAGNGISGIVNYYLASAQSTGITTASSGWTTAVQSPTEDKKYLWNYEVISYTNGGSYTSDPTIIGTYGDKGDPGQTTYFHIKYSAVSNPTSSSQMSENPNIYIGTYVDFTAADSTDPSKYTWSRFQGLQGETGEQGIPGTNGENGLTSYLHIKYSNDGGASFTSNNGETVGDYIGQYVDYTLADSTDPSDYTWAKIKGETGVGIAGVQEYYARHTSGTTAPSSWSTTPPTLTSTYRYMWNYEIITYTNGDTKETAKRVIGVYGNTGLTGGTGPAGPEGPAGETGNGISSITNYYLATSASSGVTTSTSGWTVAVQNVSADKKYLWNYEVIAYTNGDTDTSTPMIIGAYGDAGVSVSSIKEQYYLSTSKETPTGGTWEYTMPEWEFGLYVWHRSEVTYSDGEVAYTEPWCDTGWEAAYDAQRAANNAGAMASAAVEAIGSIPNRVEVKDDGLYLKDQYGASMLKINSASVNIGTTSGSNADGYSQFTASYAQFSNYQLRCTADGGLAFKLKG